jgi:hypothetical protein
MSSGIHAVKSKPTMIQRLPLLALFLSVAPVALAVTLIACYNILPESTIDALFSSFETQESPGIIGVALFAVVMLVTSVTPFMWVGGVVLGIILLVVRSKHQINRAGVAMSVVSIAFPLLLGITVLAMLFSGFLS